MTKYDKEARIIALAKKMNIKIDTKTKEMKDEEPIRNKTSKHSK